MSAIQFIASKKQQIKNQLVQLTKHESEANSSIYYTYNINGKEYRYNNSYIVNMGTTYIGNLTNTFSVKLQYNEGVEPVKHIPAHFTYIDNNGNVQQYVGENIVVDKDTNTYSASIENIKYVDEYVILNEE